MKNKFIKATCVAAFALAVMAGVVSKPVIEASYTVSTVDAAVEENVVLGQSADETFVTVRFE